MFEISSITPLQIVPLKISNVFYVLYLLTFKNTAEKYICARNKDLSKRKQIYVQN